MLEDPGRLGRLFRVVAVTTAVQQRTSGLVLARVQEIVALDAKVCGHSLSDFFFSLSFAAWFPIHLYFAQIVELCWIHQRERLRVWCVMHAHESSTARVREVGGVGLGWETA